MRNRAHCALLQIHFARKADDGGSPTSFVQNPRREDDPSFTHAYFDIFNIPLSEALKKNGNANILMIGGGGYSWPRRVFHEHPDTRVNFTVVEIDPAIPEIAKNFFWKPDAVDTVVGDGRKELSRMDDGSFDIVAVDVYSGKDIPYHLVTKEFFKMVRRKLKPGGTLASNVVTDSGSDFARLFTNTKKSVFPFVENYFTEGCMVVLGSASGLPDSGFDRLKKAVGNGDGKIFTDDWNPVELTF